LRDRALIKLMDYSFARVGAVLGMTDINLNAQSCAARRLDLGDRAVAGHVLGLELEFLI
jgi:hypothetical protein